MMSLDNGLVVPQESCVLDTILSTRFFLKNTNFGVDTNLKVSIYYLSLVCHFLYWTLYIRYGLIRQ